MTAGGEFSPWCAERSAGDGRWALSAPRAAGVILALAALCCFTADLAAQTDPRGTYRTWHTQHFRIHARAEHAAVALAAAREAERAYQALALELRAPRGTIDIVLNDHVDFPNGFTTVSPSSRVGVYLTPPAGEIGLARYDDWLRLVITHEVTHVFHLDRADGIWRVLQRIFGRAPLLFPNAYRPSWVTEGLATYYESRLTGGGRGRGGFHRQLLLASARDRRWPAPGEVSFGNAKWPSGLAPYAWGSRFFAWEAATLGDSVIPRFIDATSRRLWPLTISGPLKQAGGNGLGPAWNGFRDYWRDGVAALAASDSRLLPTILVRGLRGEPRLRLSPDGQHLAYVVVDGKHRERVVVRDLAAGKEIASHALTAALGLAWIGEDLVLAQLDFTSAIEIRSRLYSWRPGAAWRRASRFNRLTRPFAAPGGEVGAIRLGAGSSSLARLVGDSAVQALPAPPAAEWALVSLSPDGRRFAGARHAGDRWDIVVWPADAPERAHQVTDDVALDDDPAWSPDGSAVLFTSERSGLPQIYAYRLATGELAQLTDEPTGAREPALTPDGTLYFSTLLADGYAVLSRHAEPETPSASEPAPPAALIEPREVATRESAYRPWGSLLPRYWLPLLHDAGTAGFFFGGVTSGQDVIGRVGYGAALAIDPTRWEGLLSLGYRRWGGLTLDATAAQFWDAGGSVAVGGVLAPLAERDRSLSGGATFTWRRWRSQIGARLGGEITQEAFFAAESLGIRFTNPTFAGGVASFDVAYFNRPALSISPEDGMVLAGLYRRRWQVGGPPSPTTGREGWSDEWMGTVRGYLGLSLPGFARWVVAARLTGAASGGPNAQRFALGGESGGEVALLPGIAIGPGSRDFPLRGYPRDASRFTRAIVGAAELRIPLFIIGRSIWKLPLGVDRVSLAGFGELGGGWTAPGPGDVVQYRDIGGELVADLTLNGDARLRLRLGAARALTAGLGAAAGSGRYYVAIGSSF